MTESELLELAERCEKLEGPCRETDQDIHELNVIESALSGTVYPHSKKYTASIDAAMSLVPRHADWSVKYRSFSDCSASVVEVAREWGPFKAHAATPALALASACLRARASLSRLSPPNEVKHG